MCFTIIISHVTTWLDSFMLIRIVYFVDEIKMCEMCLIVKIIRAFVHKDLVKMMGGLCLIFNLNNYLNCI